MAKTPWAGLHSSRVRYHFKVSFFDLVLAWALGGQTHGASEAGEGLYAASVINDGDAAGSRDTRADRAR